MNRYIPMTEKAQQATWSKLSTNDIHMPTRFLINGDKDDAYGVCSDEDGSGFTLIFLKNLYLAKEFCKQLNETGSVSESFKNQCQPFAFAWKNIPMPAKQIEVEAV